MKMRSLLAMSTTTMLGASMMIACQPNYNATSTAHAMRSEQIAREVSEVTDQFWALRDFCDLAMKLPRSSNYRDTNGTLYLRLSNLVNHKKYRDAMAEVWITDELVRIYEKMQDIDARESQHPSVFCINIARPTPVP